MVYACWHPFKFQLANLITMIPFQHLTGNAAALGNTCFIIFFHKK
jgi:uncharacterized PurR-regulated membrane protein YhhQ (DUF165 family)